jgi:Electron transfer DM13
MYISTDKKASDSVNVGRLKASLVIRNYEIPQDVDLSKYNMVLIWCKVFSVLFGSAEL